MFPRVIKTAENGFDFMGMPSSDDGRGPERRRGLVASMLVSDDSDDSDLEFEYSFPPKKVKLQRMEEKRVKRQAKPLNKLASLKLDFGTQRDLSCFVELIEEYKYKFDLIYDNDYLFLLSILPTLLNLQPLEKFRVCQGINKILVDEANKIILEHFHGYYSTRADNYESSFFKEAKYSLPLARSSQFRREARLLQQVEEKLRFIEEYKDEQQGNPGLDSDEVYFYLMCNLPIIVLYDTPQRFIIRHAMYEKLMQIINNSLPVLDQSQTSITFGNSPNDSDDDNNKMELRVLIHKTVKIVDHHRMKPYIIDSDENYSFLIRILRAVKYLKLKPKLRLFDGINGLLIDETTCNNEAQGGTSSEFQPESIQSQYSITFKVPGRDRINAESMRLIEEKFQVIEKRIKNNVEFSMELRKDGDYLFLVSIYYTIKRLSQLQKIRLFNGILELLDGVTRSKDCLFVSVCEKKEKHDVIEWPGDSNLLYSD